MKIPEGEGTSSGGAGLSGDKKLSFIGQVAWVLANWVLSVLDSFRSSWLRVYPQFSKPELSREGTRVDTKNNSATRNACDVVWKSLPWAAISRAFPNTTLTDFGCGSGEYGLYWDRMLPLGLAGYRGIDLVASEQWEKSARFPRTFSTAGYLGDSAVETDLYFSQSALEHFREDLAFMDNLQTWVGASARPSLQIHVVPGHSQIPLVGAHGWRTYGPKMLQKLARKAPTQSNVFVVGIGGPSVNSLYLRATTVPRILSRILNKPIAWPPNEVGLEVALARDGSARPSKNRSRYSFYALVIETGNVSVFHGVGQPYSGEAP